MAFRRPIIDNQTKLTLDKLPNDSISQITWSQTSEPLLLAAGSWDRTLRIWSFKNSPSSELTADLICTFKQNEPILCSTFTNVRPGCDSVKLFGGGCNGVVLMYDLKKASPHGMLIARHDQPIMGVHWSPKFKLLMTCGWDGNVRAWDGRQQGPVWSENVGSKIFASDFKNNVLCVADGLKKLSAWNLENIQNPQNKIVIETSLKLKTKSIAIFPELLGTKGVVCGSIGGRCSVNYFMEQDRKGNFSYKCHRQDQPGRGTQTFPVNAIDFHDKYGTFITGGGDGTFTVWDKDNKTKVKTFNNVNAPVVDIKIMGENNLLAYATSYDWEKGFNKALMKKTIRSIGIIKLKEEDVKTKPKFLVGRR
ncbi:hypothetical protein MACJ_003345 [Theileria orientalis]|uniref:mRNA export protein n=1 Tax=Theileria orientalis TaxID=68886 RepID=A0A976SK46_THEOR|nr:hypothetical protein MACJ_003345 [Theileria orientalis]